MNVEDRGYRIDPIVGNAGGKRNVRNYKAPEIITL